MARVSADTRRELLVDAAIRVMARDGVPKTTTRSIVAEADMRLGVFHYCFRSKAELFEQVIQTITGHTLDRAMAVFERGGTLEEQLVGGFRAYWDHVVEFPDEHRVTYELTSYANREPELADVATKQYAHYLAANTQILNILADRNNITWAKPLPAMARYLAAMIDGMTLLYLNEGDDENAWGAIEMAIEHVVSLAHEAA